MNTAAIITPAMMAQAPPAQQVQETDSTDSFMGLLNLLLGGFNTSSKSEIQLEQAESEETKSAGDPSTEQTDQSREMLATGVMISTMSFMQQNPGEDVNHLAANECSLQDESAEPLSISNTKADFDFQTAVKQNIITKPIESVKNETAFTGSIVNKADAHLKTDYMQPDMTQTAPAEIIRDNTPVPVKRMSSLSQSDNSHMQIQSDKLISEALSVKSEAKQNSHEQTDLTNKSVDSGSPIKSQTEGQPPLVELKMSSGETQDEIKAQSVGQASLFKLKTPSTETEAEIKPKADESIQASLVRQTGSVVNTDTARIEQVEKAVRNTDIKSSAASQISTGALDALKNGKSDFKLTLKPDGLGEIEVNMTLDGGKLSMKISTEFASTQKLISTQLPQLRQELASGEQNLTSLGVELRQNGYSASNGGGFGRQYEQQRRQTLETAIPYIPEESETKSYILQQISGSSRIHYRI